MRTRRSRGVKQTRKGGNARENFERYKSNWSSQEKYNQKTYYPTLVEKLRGFKPSLRVDLETENTYIFQRHGFSCANLLKAKKDTFHFRVPDPSLTAYGILTLLRNNEKPPAFEGRVFTSSLIRTVQTAILEYGMHGNLELIMSPYIKEKNGMIADLANFPLPFDQQIAHMEQFMKFLKGINSEVARAIISNQHTIVFKDQSYTLSSYELPPMVTIPPSKPSKSIESLHQEMFGTANSETERRVYEYPIPEDPDEREDYSYVTRAKIAVGDTIPAVREPTITKYAFIPTVLSIPEANYSKYYGPEGFIYFDYWVKRNYPDVKVVFVVSHSNFMQKIIQEYCEVPLVTTIFDENAWKLSIRPKPSSDPVEHSNYIFELYHGIPKPTPNELSLMSLKAEPSCRTAVVEVSNEQDVEDRLRQTEVANHSSIPTFKPAPTYLNSTNPAPSGLNSTKPAPSVVNPVRLTEEPPEVPIQSRDVTLETKFDITRSFTELVHMLSNPGIAQGLSLLIDSPKELKTKVLQFVYSNPSLIDTPSFFSRFKKPSAPLYLFQNHYLAFILMYSPFYNTLVQRLESNSDMLTRFNITSHPSSVIRFLKQLRTLIDTDAELYQVLLPIFAVNANKHYSFVAPPKVYAFTLLDLLLYEMLPMTKEKIELMYPLFIILVRKGARFSKTIYSENAVETVKMPISELKQFVEVEQFAIKQQWEDANRRLDPTNELGKLNEQFRLAKQRLQDVNAKVNRRSTQMQQQLEQQSAILDEMYDIRRRYSEESARLDPNQELSRLRIAYRETINETIFDYLYGSFAEYIPSYDLELKNLHKKLLKKIKSPESIPTSVSIGGSRGTSWKKSSLRQFSTKAARYRASLYKGKRRTRANRS
jgi:hypothetical protein